VSQLRLVRIAPSFEAWRGAARSLLAAELPPAEVEWAGQEDGQGSLLPEIPVEPATASRHSVPRDFIPLGEAVACHADAERWGLLYRFLWRLTHGERHLLRVASDPDTHRLLSMEKAVRRAAHKMKAFVRFRGVPEEDGEVRYVAWFDPGHHVVERTAPFFAERFPSMRWSILTPLACAHWDGTLGMTPGAPRSMAPRSDDLEALWRTYYASTFNPARVRPEAMRAEMPVRYWKNLPEASLIAPLMRDAPGRVARMVEDSRKGS
jgi:uracil-DNA glycosylase